MMIGQSLILDRGLQRSLVDLEKQALRQELQLSTAFLGRLDPVEPDSVVAILGAQLDYAVTVLDRSGTILAVSSDLPPRLRGVSIPLDRREIQGALRGEVGFAEREESGGVGLRLFAAAPLVSGDREMILQVSGPLGGFQEMATARTRSLIALGLVTLLLSVGLVLLLGRLLASPLKNLAGQVEAFSASGTPPGESEAIGIQEIGRLREALNGMTEALALRLETQASQTDEVQGLIDYMGEAVVSLSRDSRLLQMNQAAMDLLEIPRPSKPGPIRALVQSPALRSLLEEAVSVSFSSRELTHRGREFLVSSKGGANGGAIVTFVDVTEIRRVEVVRRDFVANASHELKTPLTAVRGFAETLLEDDVPEDLRKQWLASIRTHTIRLQRLVEDLLDLSRLESGGWLARKEKVDLGSIVEDVFADLSISAEERGVILSLSGDATVKADHQGVEQILRNLVENAIRYSPKGGEVSVSIEGGGTHARVAVRDHGPGIPRFAIGRIFERFFRVDPARSRREGGTGLGLAIVRHLVNAMGGEVWAESQMGEGATVIFTLPAAES